MRSNRLSILTATLVTACASAAVQPSFEFQPTTGPLRYDVQVNESNVVETPMGTQESTGGMTTTVALEIGPRGPAGFEMSAVYEALEGRSSEGSYRGGELLGKSFSGTLKPDGTISIAGGPETPTGLKTYFDPRAFLAELLSPMPPEGTVGMESWPVRRETSWETALSITTLLEGTARVVGDTTWNGVAARLIVTDGEVQLSGGGTPPGSPAGELTLTATGPVTMRTVWDPARGVMLASKIMQDLAGDVTVVEMGMTLPLTYKGEQTVTLKQ